MTNLKQGVDELKTMQQASPKLGNTGKKRAAGTRKSAAAEALTAKEMSLADIATEAATEAAAEAENIIEDLAEQLHGVVRELEEAAIERPALALLAAFGIGVIVGQLFSRR